MDRTGFSGVEQAAKPFGGASHAMRWGTLLLFAVALTLASGVARGATYKWVDEKGVIHYTDHMFPSQMPIQRTSACRAFA